MNVINDKKAIRVKEIIDKNYLPKKNEINIMMAGGASCPDSILERLLEKICNYYNETINKKEIINTFLAKK